MHTFRVVPLRLEIKGVEFQRGDIVGFLKIFDGGSKGSILSTYRYRMQPPHYCLEHKPECYRWFTQKELDGMQPHWITPQDELFTTSRGTL